MADCTDIGPDQTVKTHKVALRPNRAVGGVDTGRVFPILLTDFKNKILQPSSQDDKRD